MRKFLLMFITLGSAISLMAQTDNMPELPVIKGYKGNPGIITKYNSFNFLTITDKSGDNNRQSTGEYWEVTYSYDSAFQQKKKFGEFVEKQITEKGGTLFFKDTTAIHFAIADNDRNLWGKFILSSNSMYKLRLIKERAFVNSVVFDKEQEIRFDDFVIPVELPDRIGYVANSVIVRAEQSKFNHYSFTYTTKDGKTYQQKLMGPSWEFKLEVQDEEGEVDKSISYVEIQESYYRAALTAGGSIVKNRSREVIFKLPGEEFTIWVRLSVNMDGVYFLRVINQFPQDFQEPIQLYATQDTDSLPGKSE